VGLPKFKIAAGGNREAAMVEPGRSFGEEAAVVRVVSVQGDHQLPVASRENFPDSSGVRDFENRMDVEDRFVPSDAGIEVGDGDRQMVKAGLGDVGHDLPWGDRARSVLINRSAVCGRNAPGT
jgi:hypothetical protein